MHRKLITLECISKVEFKTCPFEKSFAEFLCKHGNAAAFLLGIMHRNVRVAKDLFGGVVLGVTWSNTDIDADRDAVAAKRKWLGDAFGDPACNFLGFAGGREISEDNGKLISAQPCYRIRGRNHSYKPFRRDHQNFVTDSMAQTVVYIFESLYVEEQHMEIL